LGGRAVLCDGYCVHFDRRRFPPHFDHRAGVFTARAHRWFVRMARDGRKETRACDATEDEHETMGKQSPCEKT
jgi:hypothetical protein